MERRNFVKVISAAAGLAVAVRALLVELLAATPTKVSLKPFTAIPLSLCAATAVAPPVAVKVVGPSLPFA